MFIKKIVKHGTWIIAVGVVVLLCLQFPVQPAHAQSAMTVFASGLNNPRGLKFGPDGNLYVAVGGPANNTLSTVGQCQQVPGGPDDPVNPAGPGPYTGGFNSSILKISPDGAQVTVVAGGLPSSQTNAAFNYLTSGVADVAFIGNTLYGIEAGAGCSHGLAGTDNAVFRVNPDGSTTTIADLSQFQKDNPVANPEPDDFEPDGTWYSMLSIGNALYAVEPNHGELDRILLNGMIKRVVDISASQGHIVPTALAFYRRDFYVGNLSTFPVTSGSSVILKINEGGQINKKYDTSGLTTVVGVTFDAQGRMYALESIPVDQFPKAYMPNAGMVVRVNDDGTLTTVASGLNFPTAMTFGPDGALYVSNWGFGAPQPDMGQIVRITIGD